MSVSVQLGQSFSKSLVIKSRQETPQISTDGKKKPFPIPLMGTLVSLLENKGYKEEGENRPIPCETASLPQGTGNWQSV